MHAGSAMLRGRVAARAPSCARSIKGCNWAPCVARPIRQPPQRARVQLAVAAIEATPVDETAQQQGEALSALHLAEVEVAELDAAAEDALGWLLSRNEEEQEEDLDEMVDYDEFGDDEYSAELHGQVESFIEASFSDVRVGDRIVGTVFEVDDDAAYVELGDKASGYVPVAECSFAKLKTPLEVLRVGMKREFVVIKKEDADGQMVLSLAALEATIMWRRMQQMMEEGTVVTVKVASANRGGLLVQYGVLDGFLPVGQFGPNITVDNMESMVGTELPVQFLDVNEEGERLVFSNKSAGGSVAALADIKIGDVVEGVVRMVKPFGAFVDIGGMSGLLHVSQISSERITTVDKLFAEGDRIKVMVLSVDRERGRITLSTKKLEAIKGDMLRDPQAVYENAEATAAQFMERVKLTQQQLADGALASNEAEFAGAV